MLFNSASDASDGMLSPAFAAENIFPTLTEPLTDEKDPEFDAEEYMELTALLAESIMFDTVNPFGSCGSLNDSCSAIPPYVLSNKDIQFCDFPLKSIPLKESERLAGKEGYKHPVRVVYNPKTMTYRTILNKSKFQVIDKKDLEFYKEAEKTDKSIKVCEVNEEDFLYLNFDTNPKPTEEELMQMLEKARKEMSGLEKEKYNSEVQLTEDFQFNENIVNVPNFGTQKEEWNLSGTIEQCIIRYASKLDGDQMNEILLGLEE